SLPCGILHHDPAFLLRLTVCEAYRLIVVEIGDGGIRTLGANIRQALRRGALRHVNDGMLAETVSRPRHAAAVVAVSGSDEGKFTEFLAHLSGENARCGQLRNILA